MSTFCPTSDIEGVCGLMDTCVRAWRVSMHARLEACAPAAPTRGAYAWSATAHHNQHPLQHSWRGPVFPYLHVGMSRKSKRPCAMVQMRAEYACMLPRMYRCVSCACASLLHACVDACTHVRENARADAYGCTRAAGMRACVSACMHTCMHIGMDDERPFRMQLAFPPQ